MAQANRESTAPAPEAHPIPSDAELISRAWNMIAGLEDDVRAVRDYGHILVAGLSAGAEEGYGGLGAALNRLGRDILDRYETIEEERVKLFHMLHSRRGEPGFALDDDGNGEDEESAGDAVASATGRDTKPNAPESGETAWGMLLSVNDALEEIAKLGHTALLAGIGVEQQDEEDGAAISALGIKIRDMATEASKTCDRAMDLVRADHIAAMRS